MWYGEKISRKKKKGIMPFVFFHILVALGMAVIVHYFFIRIYKIQNVLDYTKSFYVLVNVFNKNFKENDTILAYHPEESHWIVYGTILAIGPEKIKVENQEIHIRGEKIFLKDPIPEIFRVKKTIFLNQNEVFILAENSIDSIYIDKIPRSHIIGTIIDFF